MPELRLTRRALADLDLDPEACARRSAREYADADPTGVVAAFVDRRGRHPEGQETTRLPVTRATVFNLHAGRWRGLTWHQRDEDGLDVVWLLGVGYHKSGDADDAYEVLKQRDRASTLFPDKRDYLDLEPTREDFDAFLATVDRDAPALLRRARAQPGDAITVDLGRVLQVSVVVERMLDLDTGEALEDVDIGFHLPPEVDGVLPPYPGWLTTVLACMLPDADLCDLDFGQPFPVRLDPRPVRLETVRWSH